MTDDIRATSQRTPRVWQTVKAVLWAMIGLRKGVGYGEDMQRLNPVHVVLAGVIAGVLFVVVLIAIVRWAVASLS